MRSLLKTEQVVVLLATYFATILLGHPWWLFFALLLFPDISMLGYIAGPRIGAFIYNLFHHQGIAAILILIGWYTPHEWILMAGIIMFGHSAMDRVFGYGLKYFSGFKDTHLGRIGK